MRHFLKVNQRSPVQEARLGFDVMKIREDFPILETRVHGRELIYLDNAATTQKPQIVIDNITNYYQTYNSNIHRGVHYLSQYATRKYEVARKNIQRFINAKFTEEIIYTRGATESLNLLASTYGRAIIHEGDEILISAMEHHSNIVPWQMLCEEKNAKLKVIPINDSGEIIFDEFLRLISPRTKILSIVQISNSLGTINPVKEMIDIAHEYDITVIVDGAQSIQHKKIDVQELDCDFFVFSGHKIYGPTGIGILYGKKHLLEKMPPYQGGGDMILSVSFEKTTYNELPYKFEAGTPNIAGAIGLGAAVTYIQSIGIEEISHYEDDLLNYATEIISGIEGIRIIGTSDKKTSVLSFVFDDIHPHDIGTLLDMEGLAVRTGHHCTEPVMRRFKVPATTRASFSFYNTFDEVEMLANALNKVKKMFS